MRSALPAPPALRAPRRLAAAAVIVVVLALAPARGGAEEPFPLSVKVGERVLVCGTGAILCPAAAGRCDDPAVAVPEETPADGLAFRGVKPGSTLCSAGAGSGQGLRRVFRVTVGAEPLQ